MDFHFEMNADQIDSLEHLPNAAYKEQKQYTCLHCRKAVEISIVKMGSQADQQVEAELQWNSLISWLVSFPPKYRLRLKPEHIITLRSEHTVLIHANCPRCHKTIPSIIRLK